MRESKSITEGEISRSGYSLTILYSLVVGARSRAPPMLRLIY